MSENETLGCFRCAKVATTYVPEVQRVLCDDHFETFKEAYSNLRISAVTIDDTVVEGIKDAIGYKEASDLATGIEFSHRVPVTLIDDHLGELQTGTEPATCKVCEKPMQLHAQWTTTKQVFTGAASEGALDPDFLKHFDEFGNCLDCRTNDGVSRGYYLVDVPMSRADMIAHLNGHDHQEGEEHRDEAEPSETESGNVHREEILGSVLANVNKEKAEATNFPIYVDQDGVIWWNKKHRAKQPVVFPLGMSEWNPQYDSEGKMIEGTGTTFPSYNWFHSFLDHITGEMHAPNSCLTCEGTGAHPELHDEPDVAAHFEEQRIKAERARTRELKSKPPRSKSAHSGPGIKPHDHHNKKKRYAPRGTGPMGRGGAKLPVTRGSGIAASVSGGGFGSLIFPPIERWWYDQMNMFHDITHTEYKTPSYMYRNPNPMYYSPGSRKVMVSKPWKN